MEIRLVKQSVTPTQCFTGVILAGGMSQRMGLDKAMLQLRGITLIESARRLLRSAGAANIIVLGRPDLEGGIADKTPFGGPASAIADYLTLQPLNSRHLFIPVDMPNLSAALLRLLAGHSTNAYFANYFLPFVAGARPFVRPGVVRLRDFLKEICATQLEAPDGVEACFANLNTIEDYQRVVNSGPLASGP